MATARRRLDRELVRRGLAADPDQAAALVGARRVLVGGAVADGPGRLVAAGEAVALAPEPSAFVSRAGAKLDGALDRFAVDVTGRTGLDVGASTGGFTDCLLQRGAASVVALDVGHGQLHERLRADPRVAVVERCNVRDLAPGGPAHERRLDLVGRPAEVVVVDVSFISLRAVLDALVALAAPGADLLLLVKPQFEATREEADRARGIISSPDVWARVLHEVLSALEARGAVIMGAMVSPVRGAGGNVEFAIHALAPDATSAAARAAGDRASARPVDALVDEVVAEAVAVVAAGPQAVGTGPGTAP